MKILFLSVCGKTNEDDDARYVNLYLASLKKHIVPNFEVKVILLNNSNVKDSKDGLVYKRVRDFGLEDVVDVRSLYEMELPEDSLKFMAGMHWSGKIGLNMNMMMDYSKRHALFDADWIVHTDTDSEFLPNFTENILSLHEFSKVQPQIVVSLAGDAYPYNFRYKEKEFLISAPNRINIYDDTTTIRHGFNYYDVKMNIRDEKYYIENENLILNVQQQKVRNDFFAMTRAAALNNIFNWTNAHYPNDLRAMDKESESQAALQELWESLGSDRFKISLNHDKGSLVQYQLQEGFNQMAKVQLKINADMMKHFGGGYCNGEDFTTYSAARLRKDYEELSGLWEDDYA